MQWHNVRGFFCSGCARHITANASSNHYFFEVKDCWFKQVQTAKIFFSLKESWSSPTQHIPIYSFPPHCVLSSPPVTLLSVLQSFELLIPIVMTSSGSWRHCLRWPRLFGEGLCHFMWNNKEQWQSVVLNVLLMKALIAECTQNLHTEMKREATFRVMPSLWLW